jgi:tetratricopeptide (TPR) repeat protein
MYRQDYIKRMVEEIGALWALIHKALLAENLPLAFQELDKAFVELAGVDRDTAQKTTAEFLVLMTSMRKANDVDRTLALAELLTLEADAYEHLDQHEMRARLLAKALEVLLQANATQTYAGSEIHLQRIDTLFERLKPSGFEAATAWRLFTFFERQGRYDKAEDMILDLLDQDEQYRDHAADYYERLRELPDHVLVLGGLPRDEVELGIERLQA